MDMLKFQVTSRREFERLKASNPEILTDLERAARFIYLQKTAFDGKVSGRNFGVNKHGGARFNLTRLAPLLEDIHERLSGVVIECLDWKEFIRRWDRPGMLVYLDPPYWGNESDYGCGVFGREDFAQMAEILARIKVTVFCRSTTGRRCGRCFQTSRWCRLTAATRSKGERGRRCAS